MQEGGSRVALIANWPGTTPAGVVNHDLTDFSDFFPTFADLGRAKLPANLTIDGHSFAAPLTGRKGALGAKPAPGGPRSASRRQGQGQARDAQGTATAGAEEEEKEGRVAPWPRRDLTAQ